MNLHQRRRYQAIVQIKSGFSGIQTHDLCDTSAVINHVFMSSFAVQIYDFFIHLFTKTIQMSILSKMNDRLLKQDWTVVALMVFLFKMFLYDFAWKDKATQVHLAFKWTITLILKLISSPYCALSRVCLRDFFCFM